MDNLEGGLEKLSAIEKSLKGMAELPRLVNELKEREIQLQKIIKDLQGRVNQMEERLKQTEEIRQTIFEWAESAVAVLNEEDLIIVQANKKLEEILGIRREEMENEKSLSEFIDEVDLERIKNHCLAVRSGSDGLSGGREYRFVDQQGNWKDILVTLTLIPDTGRITASFLDVTRHNQLRRRLSSGRRLNIIK